MESNTSDLGNTPRPKLPRRDWVMLPLIGLLTFCLLAACSHLIARSELSTSQTSFSDCLVANDTTTGVRAIPNSVCWVKAGESKLIEYKFNKCGMRADFECAPKVPGTFRIAAIGSSYTLGDQVNNQDAFASRLPVELSQLTGRNVELYNNGMLWGVPHSTSLRFNAVLRNQAPDMILWTLTPWDIQNSTVVLPLSKRQSDQAGPQRTASMSVPAAVHRLRGYFTKDEIPPSVSAEILLIKAMLQHFLYRSQSLYLKSYLMNASEAGFLSVEANADWAEHLKDFEVYAAQMEEQAAAAHVPFAVVLVPNRAQAAMISMGECPSGYDPYQLGNELRTIVTSHGGVYIDILPGFRNIPNPERYYHAVDGHPDARGHEIIAGLLAKALTGGAVTSLTTEKKPQLVSGVEK